MQWNTERPSVVRWLLVGQFAGTLLVGLAGLAFSASAGLGALLGGLIVWLPNCYFAFRAFRYRGAKAAKQVVNSFYAGAFGKMLLVMSMFALVFGLVRPLNAPAVFAGFTSVLMLNWLIPLVNSTLANASHKASLQSGSTDHGN